MNVLENIDAASTILRQHLQGEVPDIAIVTGSGLADGLAQLQTEFLLTMSELPDFPDVGVTGQRSRLSFGTLFGRSVLAFQGRYHLYEGYSAWQVTAQVRLAAAVGCRKILLTNAAGGIADNMTTGDFMLVTDHLNLTGTNPLVGRKEREFVDLSNVYDVTGIDELKESLQTKGVNLHQGVLAWMIGPSYETPAEINFLEMAGAAAVSMSTIPEAIVAKRYGLQVKGVSFIANSAAGKSCGIPLDHTDVLRAGQRHVAGFQTLLAEVLARWF